MTTIRLWVSLFLLGVIVTAQPTQQPCPNAVDLVDSTYGGRIRQLAKADGHEHNIYYHRNVFNADNSYLIGIQSDLQQQNWRVVLYTGDGCYLKELFPISQYDWRLVWDRNDPAILYTWKGSNLYRFDVNTATAVLLKNFAPLNIRVGGPSLNQAGNRILVITTDNVFHTFRLPGMSDERAFSVTLPAGCFTDWEDERYIGYGNYIATGCGSSTETHTYIYNDSGSLFHHFNGFYFGHTDFSPDGRWAYYRLPGGGRPLEIHVVNLDGTNDRVVYSASQFEARFVSNLHLSWPDKVNDWLIAGFFPSALNLPPTYGAPLDEILLVGANGTHKFLARTGTAVIREDFWRQTLASPSADGSRISFHSNRSGTIDQYILFVSHPAAVTSVSAASFSGGSLAAEAIVAAFGSGLATSTTAAAASPLPTTLAGTTVKARDSAGVERLAPLFFVSPTQVNYQIPPGTANGAATVTITSGDGKVSAGAIQIATVAPGLFSANVSGQGVAAAVALRVRQDGAQSYEPVAQFDPAQNKFVAAPIDLGPENEQVFLILFGTGIRFRSALSAVTAKLGGVDCQVAFAGAQDGYVGLDQVNVRLSRSLIGRGEVDVTLTVDGQAANSVKANVK